MAPEAGLLEADPATVANAPNAVDDFFTGSEGLISTWDFDADMIIGFQSRLQWAQLTCNPAQWLSCLCCYPCYLGKNVEWKTKAQHLALTADGVRYVQEKYPTLCGFSCTDKGRTSTIIPYDKIATCDVQEPVGTACCCIKNVLCNVRIETCKAEDGVPRELTLSGLKYPNAFKQALFTMKHSESPSHEHDYWPEKVNSNSGQLLERNQMLAMVLKKFPKELLRDRNGALQVES